MNKKVICSKLDSGSVELRIGSIILRLDTEDAQAIEDAIHRCLHKQNHPIGAGDLSRPCDRRRLRKASN